MNRTTFAIFMPLMGVATILLACYRSPPPLPESVTEEIDSFINSLPNAEYPIEWASSGKALLKDGLFEEQAAPGSATMTRVSLGDVRAVGDLNADGIRDAVVTLICNPGGSGTFYYLAAVLNRNGSAQPVAATHLGDRIQVQSLSISSGEITVILLDRGPDEAFAAPPTIKVTRSFKLMEGELIEL